MRKKIAQILYKLEDASMGYITPPVAIIGFLVIVIALLKMLFPPFNNAYVDYGLISTDLYYGQIWRLLTAPFFTYGIGGLAFPLITWVFFSGRVQRELGTKYFLQLLFFGVVAATILLSIIQPTALQLIGFGLLSYAVLVAFATLFPFTMFFFIPAWIFVLVLIIIDILQAIESPTGRFAVMAKLSAGAMAFLMCHFRANFANMFKKAEQMNPVEIAKDKVADYQEQKHENEREEIDRLLAKVSAEGLPSLTDKERKFLNDYSAKQRKSS